MIYLHCRRILSYNHALFVELVVDSPFVILDSMEDFVFSGERAISVRTDKHFETMCSK